MPRSSGVHARPAVHQSSQPMRHEVIQIAHAAESDGVKVGTAKGTSKVTKTDIKAKNGVIHVIDAVILP